MKFETSPELTPEQQVAFESQWETARQTQDPALAFESVRACLAIDPDHAGANYLLGSLLYAEGDFAQAAQHLTQARDTDVCPLRAPTAIANSVTEVARERRVPVVDAEVLFADLSQHGIVGNQWLVDHIHPSVEGHQVLGRKIAEVCLDAGVIAEANPGWRELLAQKNAEHLATLGEEYFHRGNQRLEGLRLWTQGRARKVRSPSP